MKKLKLFFACLLMAVLSIGQVWATTTYTKVTSVSSLSDGDKVVIAQGSTAPTVGVKGGTVQSSTTTKKDAVVSSTESEWLQFTVTTTTGGWYLSDGTNWIGNPAANTFYLTTSTSCKGVCSVDENGVLVSNSRYLVQNSTYYRMYTSVGSNTPFYVWKVTTSGGSEPALSVSPAVIDFGTVDQNASVEPQEVTVTFENLTGTVSYSGLSGAFVASGTIDNSGDKITITPNTATIGNYSQTLTVQSAADSKSQDVTVKMNVVEPFDGLKLTFDFVTHPEGWPAAKASAVAGNYVYTISATDYTFAHSKVGDGIYCGGTSGSSGYLMIAKSNSLGLPAISGYKLVKVEGTLNNSGTPSTKAEITITNGTDEVTGGASQTWDEKGVAKTYNLSGTVANTMYYLNVSGTANLQMITLVLYYEEAEAPTVAAPTISGVTPFLSSTEVTLTQNDADAIYYTTDEAEKENPSVDTWTEYNSASKPSFNATTTIYAAAIKGSAWSAVAEKTFTKATILTVAEALTIIEGLNNKTATTAEYYVSGVVSTVTALTVDGTGEYYISADGTKTSELQVYKGKWVGGANFTSTDQLIEGDDVTIKGKLKKYNDYKELDQNNEVVLYKLKARLAWSEESYEADLSSSNTYPSLTNTNGVSVSYSSSNTDAATIDPATGDITLVAIGSTNITATFAGNETYKANSVSYTLNVSNSVLRADISFEENGGSEVADLTNQSNLPDPLPTITKAGKNFGGWWTTSTFEAGTEAVAGAAVESTDDIVLYAKWLDPYTVAEAMTIIAALDNNASTAAQVYVEGVISQVDEFNSTYHSITYWISADGTTSSQLEVYSGKGLSSADFSAVTDLQEGDEVVVYGYLKKYVKNETTTPEFDKNNYLYSFNRPVVAVSSVSLPATETVEVGSTVTLTATVLPDNASDKSITWTVESGDTYASVENGVVSGLVAGEAVIRATSVADGTKYAECTVTVVAADPTKHVVTFDAAVDQGESPLSKSNITFTCSSGVLNNGSEYRLYKSSTTTLACSVGNITKIEFTGVSGNPVSGFGDPEVGTLVTEGNNGVWTGNAESVSFVASGAQVRATEIVVTYKEDNRAAAGLTWSTDAVELTVGDEFTAPTLNNPNSIAAGEITIASDNTDLATVSEGVVSLVADATGIATITATFEGNEDYKPAVVSYTITVNEAGLDNVTFDATQDIAGTSELSISKSGFTLEFTDGALGNGSEYRLYKSQTMTLSSTDYLIKKIEFTCTSGNPITGFADATGLDKDNNEWTGESNTVELTASNAQVRMTKIKVFYVEDTRAAAGLAWNPAEDITLTVGDALSAPALQNPNSIDASEITIASSNESVATVSEGVVSLVADATGTTTITATFAGNDDYKPATVSYKIKVNPAHSIYVQPSLNVNFGSVNQDAVVADKSITVTLTGVDAATLTLGGAGASAFTISPAAALPASGDVTISASSANIGTFVATLTISDDAGNAESKVVNISITVNEVVTPETPVSTTSKWVPATEIADGMQVLIVGERSEKIYAVGAQTSNNRTAVEGSLSEGVFTPGENTMAFTVVAQEGGTYALQASNGKYLYAAGSGSGKNYLRSQDEVDDNAKWTLSVSSATANGTNTNNKLQLNNSSDIFSCYSSTQKAIQFYVPKPVTPPTPVYETVRTLLEVGRYYTVCLPKQVTAIKGATFWKLEKKSEDGSQAYLEEETNNLPFAAGKPFIIQATADKLEVVYEGEATETAGVNGAIHGTLTYMDADALAAAGSNVYMLYNNELRPVGENNHLDANRAYVKVDELDPVSSVPQGAPGKRVVAMPMQKDQAQGFDNLESGDAPKKVMIDGTLYILRGEKVFDATGRLVK